MDSTLTLLREMAEQHEYQALYYACCEQLQQDESRPVQLLLSLAYAYIDEQDAARSLLDRALLGQNTQPLTVSEQQDLSAVYLALAEHDSAESVLDELLLQQADNARIIARKAYCRLMQNDRLAAYDLYRRAFKLDNSKVEIAINLCLLLLANHTEKDAVFLVDSSLVMVQVHSYLAQADHQFAHARNHYSEARYQHLQSQLNAIRLEAWLLEGKQAHAEQWLRTQFHDLTEYRDNTLLLADQLQQIISPYAAQAILLDAAKRVPNEPAFYQQLAELSYQQAHYADAHYYHEESHARSLSSLDNPANRWPPTDQMAPLAPLDFALSERIRGRFTPAFFNQLQHRRGETDSFTALQPIFIVGLPYSGKSLLEQWLICSPDIASIGASAHFPLLIEGLNQQQRQKGSERAYPDIMDSITAEHIQELASGIESLYQRKCPTAQWVIDKNADNIQHLGLIKCIFPNAKIIAVRRDPRALALSPRVRDWLTPHTEPEGTEDEKAQNIAFLLGRQLAQYNTLMSHWKSLFSEAILDVSFEELTANNPALPSRLLGFLNTPELKTSESEKHSKTLASFTQYASDDASIKWSIHRQELAALLRAMNQKSLPPTKDMATLPEPGLLSRAYELYCQGAYRDAEYQCKVILHHLADFAPAHYLLGEIYLRNGLIALGVECLNEAIRLAPWKQQEWGGNLTHALSLMPPNTAQPRYRRDQQ